MNTEALKNLFEPVVTELGFEFVGCELHAYSKNKLFRIYIDNVDPKAGVGVDDCATVSRAVSAMLDVEEPIAGDYRLEVSSPGINRPLFEIVHFERFVGERIKLRLREKLNGQKNFVGIIKSVTGVTIAVELEDVTGDNSSEVVFDFDELSRANLAPIFD